EELKRNEERATLQRRLHDTSQMLGRLKQVQHERLLAPPPADLFIFPKPSDTEMVIADRIAII
ncbi:unnamed protein product, partial [Heterotrigona itama]